MRRRAIVVAINKDSLHLRVTRAGCERCDSGQGCGAGLMAQLLSPDQFDVSLPLTEQSQLRHNHYATLHTLVPGDTVWLCGSDARLMRLAWRLYAVPCVAFMLAVGISYSLAQPWLMRGLLSHGLVDVLMLSSGLSAVLLSWRLAGPISQASPFWRSVQVVPLNRGWTER